MMVVRDSDTMTGLVEPLVCALKSGTVHELSSYQTLETLQDTRVVLITSLSAGWLKYHSEFVARHRDQTSSWIVVLVQDREEDHQNTGVLSSQIKSAFGDMHLRLFVYRPKTDDAKTLAQEILAVPDKRGQKALLYSIRPSSGKRTLAKLLQIYLPKWQFEAAQEDLPRKVLAESDAAVTVIVAKEFQELYNSERPESVHPFFVLSMPDENVQLFLQRDHFLQNRELRREMEKLAQWAGITVEAAEKRLFFISPLFELWRVNNVTPKEDVRFVMWDAFGLPIPRGEYSDAAVQDFLSQFTQGGALAEAMQK